MHHSKASSAPHLPADVLEHHIFAQLSLSGFLCARMVCQQWRNVGTGSLLKKTTTINKRAVLQSLFKEGESLEFLQWFADYLQFPVWRNNDDVYLMSSAAKGSMS